MLKQLLSLLPIAATLMPMPVAAQTPHRLTESDIPAVATSWARMYCEWRQTGVPSREESVAYAAEEFTLRMAEAYGVDESMRFFNLYQERLGDVWAVKIQELCPNDI